MGSNALESTSLHKARALSLLLHQYLADQTKCNIAELRRHLHELDSQLSASDEYAHRLKSGIYDVVALKFLIDNDLVARIPLSQPGTSFPQLAAQSGVDAGLIAALCRHLHASLLFECQDGRIWHNQHSAHFREPGAQAFVEFTASCTLPVAATWARSSMKGMSIGRHETDTPFHRHFATSQPMLEFFRHHQHRNQVFSAMRTYFATHGHLCAEGLLRLFDWNTLGRVTVVDVGGSHGDCARLLAATHAHLDVVVQDTPETISLALEQQCRWPLELQKRVWFETHDVRDRQSRSADIFILRLILHNYGDATACAILGSLLEALNPGGRILIMEMCLEESAVDLMKQRRLSTMDCEVRTMTNGGERSSGQWHTLLCTPTGLNISNDLVRIRTLPDNDLSLIEIGPVFHDFTPPNLHTAISKMCY